MYPQNKIRKIRAALLSVLLVLVLVFTATGPATAFADNGSEWELAEIRPVGDVNAVPPEITAKAATLYSLELDDFVYAKNENEKIDPYSITKILTCYLALEKLDPEKVIKASAKATKVYENGTTIFLKAGEKMTVTDLIYGTLLESGNDAAYALGEAVSGSEKKFAKLMNKTVKKWGCKDTHFVNANGWKNKDHYTTAHDMAIIARNCFANETLAEISRTKTYTIPKTNLSEARTLKNYFLETTSKAEGIVYGKTGSWDEDDCSIVAGFTRDHLSEIIVLLGDTKKGRRGDVVKLIDFSEAVTPGFLVSDEGEIVNVSWVKHGEFTKVGLAVSGRTVAYPASRNAKDIIIEKTPKKLEAPLKKGDKAGKYTVYCNGKEIADYDLIVTEDIKTGWFPSYLYISNQQTLIILKYATLILAIVLLIVILHKVLKRKKTDTGGKKGEQYTPKH